jgi:hypothetical protein
MTNIRGIVTILVLKAIVLADCFSYSDSSDSERAGGDIEYFDVTSRLLSRPRTYVNQFTARDWNELQQSSKKKRSLEKKRGNIEQWKRLGDDKDVRFLAEYGLLSPSALKMLKVDQCHDGTVESPENIPGSTSLIPLLKEKASLLSTQGKLGTGHPGTGARGTGKAELVDIPIVRNGNGNTCFDTIDIDDRYIKRSESHLLDHRRYLNMMRRLMSCLIEQGSLAMRNVSDTNENLTDLNQEIESFYDTLSQSNTDSEMFLHSHWKDLVLLNHRNVRILYELLNRLLRPNTDLVFDTRGIANTERRSRPERQDYLFSQDLAKKVCSLGNINDDTSEFAAPPGIVTICFLHSKMDPLKFKFFISIVVFIKKFFALDIQHGANLFDFVYSTVANLSLFDYDPIWADNNHHIHMDSAYHAFSVAVTRVASLPLSTLEESYQGILPGINDQMPESE